MNSAAAPEAMQPASELESGSPVSSKGRILAWAAWDWGSAAFNAVMTTFVFTVYLTSNAFGGEDQASAVLGGALAVAGAAIALLAPVTGQRSDTGGRRKLWLGVNTAAVALLTGLCFFVFPRPEFLLLGVTLIALGNVFFEFAGVNYNAMLAQISTPQNIGKVSGFGWGMGYLGGIVALLIVLQLFVQPGFAWFGASTADSLNIRLVAVFSALWFFIFALPVLFAVPEVPRTDRAPAWGSWPPTACWSGASRRSTGPARTRSTSCWRAPSSGTGWLRFSPSAGSSLPAPSASNSRKSSSSRSSATSSRPWAP